MKSSDDEYEYVVHLNGRIEIRRKDGHYEFRPIRQDEPENLTELKGNVLLTLGGGAWAPVPPHLLPDAVGAFPT